MDSKRVTPVAWCAGILLASTPALAPPLPFVPDAPGNPLAHVESWITTLAASQTPGVQARADDQPPPLYSSAVAYDAARDRAVLFGGYLAGQYSGDTWEWDSAHWMRVSQSGPSPRNGPAAAYDSLHQRLVLFGGNHGALAFGDTWTWDGTDWTLVASNGPPPRSLHRMVYDSRARRIVLFGGRTNTAIFGDTWTWDGANWTKVDSTGPAPRFLHALAWDSGRGRAVLFGGNRALGPPTDADLYLDTWEWDGARWDSVAVSGPTARDHVASAFDPMHGRTVLFGGSGTEATGLLGDTWEWSGATWERITDSGPGPRAGGTLMYTPRSGILLYGGFINQGPLTDLWAWDGADWRRVLPVAVETAPWSRIKRQYRYPNAARRSCTAISVGMRPMGRAGMTSGRLPASRRSLDACVQLG